MELIKLKVLDDKGTILLTCPAAEQLSLVYRAAYRPGDRISLEIGTPGQYIVAQFEDTMAPALIYVEKREIKNCESPTIYALSHQQLFSITDAAPGP
mgnify:FL=1